jgi:hypothetical protein
MFALATAASASASASPSTPLRDPSTVLSPAPAFYPRLAMMAYPNGTSVAVGTAAKPSGDTHQIAFLVRTSITPEVWVQQGYVVVAQGGPDIDLDNGFTYQLPNGTLLCAYRHHDGNGTARTFRIQVSSSHDFGLTWSYASTVTQGPVGVWEPFMWSSGYWDNATTVHVAYSAELTNGGEQDIVFQTSVDGGTAWNPVSSRIHTTLSRNGMPGVAELHDHSLVVVFEGFWTGFWGHFTVNSARSFDGGATWPQQEIVYAPANAGFGPSTTYCAGSPQVGVCPLTGKLVVIFMNNEPLTSASSSGSIPAWPAGAHAAVVSAHLNYSNVSAPLNFTLSPPAAIPTLTPTIYWPSLLLDPQAPCMPGAAGAMGMSDGAATSSGSGSGMRLGGGVRGNSADADEDADAAGGVSGKATGLYSLRVVYQADDNSAAVTDTTLCID